MKQITIGQVIEVNNKRYAVMQQLDCGASFDANEIKPELPSVSASPIHGSVVRGRTRYSFDDYKVIDGLVMPVKTYKVEKDL